MAKPSTKITPLDPAFHGESNYEVGLEDLLAEKRNLVAKLEANPEINHETLQSEREALQVVEGLWQNYHIGMNVFRNAKGGRDGIREVKTD
jgi:colicin import membrane protein